MSRSSNTLPLTILWMAVLLSISGVLFALEVSHSIGKRLRSMLDGIRRMESGELGVMIPVVGGDEYSLMQTAFNAMSQKTMQLVDDLVASQAKQKQAEMRLLYEQINPHFVYNTLSVIRWEALRNGEKHLADLADQLVGYLRLSLNKGHEMIEVSREVDMLAMYIKIMNYRYQNAIDYSADIAGEIEHGIMIKLILQPLVENAVLHGIMGKKERTGSIRVKGWRDSDALRFIVADDGIGMTKDQLAALLSPNGTNYGLWNVHQRLLDTYGPGSGLMFESCPGEGTVVTVTMKTVWEE